MTCMIPNRKAYYKIWKNNSYFTCLKFTMSPWITSQLSSSSKSFKPLRFLLFWSFGCKLAWPKEYVLLISLLAISSSFSSFYDNKVLFIDIWSRISLIYIHCEFYLAIYILVEFPCRNYIIYASIVMWYNTQQHASHMFLS